MELNSIEHLLATWHSYACVSGYENRITDAREDFRIGCWPHYIEKYKTPPPDPRVFVAVREAMFEAWEVQNNEWLNNGYGGINDPSTKALSLVAGRKASLRKYKLTAQFDYYYARLKNRPSSDSAT